MCFCFWSDSTWKFTFKNLKIYYHELSIPITEFTKSVTLVVHRYLLVPFAHIKAFHPLFHIHSSNLVFCWRCTSNNFFLALWNTPSYFSLRLKAGSLIIPGEIGSTNSQSQISRKDPDCPSMRRDRSYWAPVAEGWALWVTVLSVGDKL